MMATATVGSADGPSEESSLDVDLRHEPQVFAFGDFEFLVASGELRSGDTILRLAPQPATVLHVLLRRAGEVVTRQELSATLWPHGFIEADLGINHCLRQVRRALSDNAKDPVYVETLRRRGYRFMVPIDEPVASRPVPSTAQLPHAVEGASESRVHAHGFAAFLPRLAVTGVTIGSTLAAFVLALKGAIPLVIFLPLIVLVAGVGAFVTPAGEPAR